MYQISKVALLSLLVVGACNRSSTPDPIPGTTNVAEESPQPAVPIEEEPAPTNETPTTDDSGAPEASTTRVEVGVGTKTLERLNGAKTVVVARLGTDNPNTVSDQQTAFSDPRRIGGYPIASDERTLSPDEARQLAKLLTNDEDYLDVRRRCSTKTRLGARFGEATSPERVEVVLGRPCDSLVLFWSEEGGAKNWGSIVTSSMSEAFEKLISGN